MTFVSRFARKIHTNEMCASCEGVSCSLFDHIIKLLTFIYWIYRCFIAMSSRMFCIGPFISIDILFIVSNIAYFVCMWTVFVLFILCNFFCVPLYCASDFTTIEQKNRNIRNFCKIMISSEPTPNSIQLIRVHFIGNYQQNKFFADPLHSPCFSPFGAILKRWICCFRILYFGLFLTFGVFFSSSFFLPITSIF